MGSPAHPCSGDHRCGGHTAYLWPRTYGRRVWTTVSSGRRCTAGERICQKECSLNLKAVRRVCSTQPTATLSGNLTGRAESELDDEDQDSEENRYFTPIEYGMLWR
jgi:hypothetical protein